jgi:hypothetical protein
MHNEYESLLRRTSATPSDLGHRLADAASRLTAPTDRHLGAVYDIGRWVAAPLLIPYVMWILSDAHRRDLRRLYFVARDGQILLAIARQLVSQLPFDGELQYFYGSRYAWQECDLNSHAPAPSARIDESRHLSLLEQYFEQEGVFDPVPSGFVDIGWRGSLHEIVASKQYVRGAPIIHGYVFGSTRNNYQFFEKYHAYAFDYGQDYFPDPLLSDFESFRNIAECFAAANHNTVVRLERRDGVILPCFGQGWRKAARSWGIDTLHRAVTEVATTLDLGGWVAEEPRRMARVAKPVLRTFWQRPTLHEARAWACFPAEDGHGPTERRQPFAEPFHASDLGDISLLLQQRMRKRPRFWLYGAIRLTPMPHRLIFAAANMVADLLTARDRAARKMRRWLANQRSSRCLDGAAHDLTPLAPVRSQPGSSKFTDAQSRGPCSLRISRR